MRLALQALRQMPGLPQDTAPATSLRLAVTPTFSRQSLMPWLAAFRRLYPAAGWLLQVAIPLLDIKAEDADLEIHFGAGPTLGVEQVRLLTDVVVPVCSPACEAGAGPFEHQFERADEVQRVRLIRSPRVPRGMGYGVWGSPPLASSCLSRARGRSSTTSDRRWTTQQRASASR